MRAPCSRTAVVAWLWLGLWLVSAPSLLGAADRAKGTGAEESPRVQAQRLVQQAMSGPSAEDSGLRRQQLLQEALAIDPNCKLARWHLGQVEVDGRWFRLESAERHWQRNELQAQYLQLRDAAIEDPGRWSSLAKWSRRHQLSDEERFAWTQVLHSTASSARDRQAAAKSLGMASVGGRWLTAKEQALLTAQEQARNDADRNWRRKLVQWRDAIEGRSPAMRREAIENVLAIRDDAVIPLLEELYFRSSSEAAMATVEVLSDWPHAEASRSLVRHVLGSPWPQVRDKALEKLSARPWHDYVPAVLSSLVPTVQSKFSISPATNGGIIYQHLIHRPGQDINRQLMLQRSWAASTASVRVGQLPPEQIAESNRQSLQRAAEQRAAQLLESVVTAQRMEQQVERENAWIVVNQQAVYSLLRTATQQNLPDDAASWWDWWQDYNDRTQPTKPTLTYYENQPEIDVVVRVLVPHECFAAGTAVRTPYGSRPIEQIRIGDRVLSQSVETGELAYKLVTATTIRPVTSHCRMEIGEDHIVCTWGHPFWLEKEGWRMARHLRAGDQIHTATGPRTIDHIESAEPQEAYNLVVEDFHSYFVGAATILAHDHTERLSTRAWTPSLLRESLADNTKRLSGNGENPGTRASRPPILASTLSEPAERPRTKHAVRSGTKRL